MNEKWIIIAWSCDRDIAVLIDDEGVSQTFDTEDDAVTFAESQLSAEWVTICINV